MTTLQDQLHAILRNLGDDVSDEDLAKHLLADSIGTGATPNAAFAGWFPTVKGVSTTFINKAVTMKTLIFNNVVFEGTVSQDWNGSSSGILVVHGDPKEVSFVGHNEPVNEMRKRGRLVLKFLVNNSVVGSYVGSPLSTVGDLVAYCGGSGTFKL
ncbi:hypothetical protein ONZ45_g12792 [Pleurotus djamor]|nr:hypothetical protein ONZ45_g12792 [Pleurotus djamor]